MPFTKPYKVKLIIIEIIHVHSFISYDQFGYLKTGMSVIKFRKYMVNELFLPGDDSSLNFRPPPFCISHTMYCSRCISI